MAESKDTPSLTDLGLDQPAEQTAFDGAFKNYIEQEPPAKSWIDTVKLDSSIKQFHPALAAVLSFIIPGAGQVYKLHIFSGFFWLLLTLALYLNFWPVGVVAHLGCVLFAAGFPK